MKTESIYFDNIKREITYHIGTNSQDNFDVIDVSTPYDLWFHTKDGSSCHVVAKVSEITEKLNKKELLTICKKGAAICKANTNRVKKNQNVEFIYTNINNVIKTSTLGCVTIQNEKTIIC